MAGVRELRHKKRRRGQVRWESPRCKSGRFGSLTRDCALVTALSVWKADASSLAGKLAGALLQTEGDWVPSYLSELLCSLIFQASQQMLIGAVARQIHGI